MLSHTTNTPKRQQITDPSIKFDFFMISRLKINFTFIVLLCIQSAISNAQCCNYRLFMQDSYGDGWNGATLQVLINNQSIGIFSASNFENTEFISICNGDSLDLIYTANMYENENSYKLQDTAWNIVFHDGPDPDTSLVFSPIGNCYLLECSLYTKYSSNLKQT